MKKTTLIILIILLLPFYISANELELVNGELEFDSPLEKNITYEIGFFNFDIGVSNSLMPTWNYFKKKLVLDLNKLDSDLSLSFNVFSVPLYFRYYTDRNVGIFDWTGFGVSTMFEIFGHANVSETLLSLDKARNNKSVSGVAMFTGINIPVFVNYQKFKIKVQPSVFFPVVYGTPDISYTNNGYELGLNYSMRIYTIGSFEDGFNGITASPGVDFKISAEYPWSEVLDIGLDIINIPIIPSGIKDYIELSGYFSMDEINDMEFEDWFDYDTSDTIYGINKKRILRPFKMLFRANWQPLDYMLLTVTPVLGFSVNPIYKTPGAFEGGITGHIDLKDFIILSLGFNYFDRHFINSFDTILYFKNFEFDLGLNLRARNFIHSWQGKGFGIRTGFKVRW